MLEPIRLPLPARLLNVSGQWLRRLGVPLVLVTPEVLERRAQAITGLSDFGERDFHEPLRVLCHSVNHDADLSMVGRLAFRDHVTNALVTRLRRVDLHSRRPDIFSAPLVPPIIVLGLPRSGTTMLHRLLALGTGARPLYTWELQEPIAGPGPDHRRERAIARIKLLKKMVPSLDAKHYIHADEPEECVLLLESSLRSLSFWMFAPVYSYLQWYTTQDMHGAYRVYREHLQIFQAETPQQRLTLKAPAHGAHLEALRAAVPEALVVQTLRDPEPVVASVNSLFYTIHSVVARTLDVERMARANVALMRHFTEQPDGMGSSAAHNGSINIRYEQLLSDPIGVVQRIYRHFGLEFDSGFEQRLGEWLKNRPQHQFGRHEYSLEECGIERAWLHEQFRTYYETFLGGVPSGPRR